FGTLRWMLPILLLGAGWYIEWGPGKRPNSGWGATLLGLTITYLSMLGILEILDLSPFGRARTGGIVGTILATPLRALLSSPGAFVVLLALGIIGLLMSCYLRTRVVTG